MCTSPHTYSLLGFAGFSGCGKTTLLRQLVSLLTQRQLRVGIIKHTHHDVEQDSPGKDSYELRHAGAHQCLLAGPKRTILTYENPQQQEPNLAQSLARLHTHLLDLVLVEGFRDTPIKKIEIHRPSYHKPLLCLQDAHILAVATDEPQLVAPVPLLDLNNANAIADTIVRWWQAQALQVSAREYDSH